MRRLGAEEFRVRETAETELLAWSRQRPGPAMTELLDESRENTNPEVRERCLAILKELVHDEYLRDGVGYVGIWMRDDTMLVPGDQERRKVIFVLRVMPDSAAEKAGIGAGDIIAGADGEKWRDGEATKQFRSMIQGKKPRTKVMLSVLRDRELENVEIVLGRLPQEAEAAFRRGDPELAEAAAKKAREEHFEAWLKRHEAGRE